MNRTGHDRRWGFQRDHVEPPAGQFQKVPPVLTDQIDPRVVECPAVFVFEVGEPACHALAQLDGHDTFEFRV